MTGLALVTGGAGSLVWMLTERLASAGWRIRVFDLPSMDFSGLEDRADKEIVLGDIGDEGLLNNTVDGVDAVVHLAALLPPRSERDRPLTMKVNVGGTKSIISAMRSKAPSGRLVLASSVSTYGDTSSESPPVGPDHSQQAIDIYAESKITAEVLIKESGLNSVILRIAPIGVPAFLEPPEVWPFTSKQRVEMVHRADVVDAVYSAVGWEATGSVVLNVAGGPTWQLEGKQYVDGFYGFLGAPAEDAVYRDSPGWVDWYDTVESQRLLKYQNRSYSHFADDMRALIDQMMAE